MHGVLRIPSGTIGRCGGPVAIPSRRSLPPVVTSTRGPRRRAGARARDVSPQPRAWDQIRGWRWPRARDAIERLETLLAE